MRIMPDFESFLPRYVSICVMYFDWFWTDATSLKYSIDHLG